MTADPRWQPLAEAPNGTPAGLRVSNSDVNRFAAWAREHHDELRAHVVQHGAVHIRGLDAGDPQRFERAVRGFTEDLKRDYLGTSPRDAVADYVFHASELPGFYPIPQHIEMSFTNHPPTWIFFGCTIAPERFGETPVTDFRAVARDLDAGTRTRFEHRGIKVIRNYGPPGQTNRDLWQLKPWHQMFGTTDHGAVEARCAEEGFEPTWRPDGGLRLISFHKPFQRHAETGEEVWFNHTQVFHLSAAYGEYKRIARLRPSATTLAVAAFARLSTRIKRATTAVEDHAMHATHADGSEISSADMENVRDAIWKNTTRVPWRVGDVLIVDNRSTAHGRMPYKGPREVIVSWA